jgi:WD40 repeat protein
VNDFIIAGVGCDLCVYNSSDGREVAVYAGHTDTIKSVIHLEERNQYITASLDMTINIWNAAKKSVETKKEAN